MRKRWKFAKPGRIIAARQVSRLRFRKLATSLLMSMALLQLGCTHRLRAGQFFEDGAQRQLAVAAGRGSCGAVEQARRDGADPNAIGAEGMTPLHWAILKGSISGFECLLQNGADPNVVIKELSPPIIMMSVAIHRDIRFLPVALESSGNPNFGPPFGTPIIFQSIITSRNENLRERVSTSGTPRAAARSSR